MSVDLLNLTDEELMSQELPPSTEPSEPAPAEEVAPTPDAVAAEQTETPAADDSVGETAEQAAAGETDLSDVSDEDLDSAPKADHTTPQQTEEDGEEPEPEDAAASAGDGEEAEAKEEEQPQDYKALYEQIMAPFKANGKDFKPESPEEAVRLMQMGANYTKKMQALAPNLKMVQMLKNNDLLDEGHLSFLIDLQKKDPAAIQKLLKDSNIDPLDIDTSADSDYQPGNYSVSDADMAFQTAITDVSATPTGAETIQMIDKNWDTESKRVLYEQPDLISVIDSQRANGIFDTISAEIDRRRTLGELNNVPFLAAYQQVGSILQEQGKLAPAGASPKGNPAPQSKPQTVLETRTEPSKPKNAANNRAKAASAAPRSSPTPKPEFDPTLLSDEEIMKISSLNV
jgi:hypothetical protein